MLFHNNIESIKVTMTKYRPVTPLHLQAHLTTQMQRVYSN